MFIRRKLYKELGGYVGYRKTPLKEIIECRLSIVSELNAQAEKDKELKQKQAEQERELERQRNRR